MAQKDTYKYLTADQRKQLTNSSAMNIGAGLAEGGLGAIGQAAVTGGTLGSIVPGIGTLIGIGAGLLAGGIKAAGKNKAAKNELINARKDEISQQNAQYDLSQQQAAEGARQKMMGGMQQNTYNLGAVAQNPTAAQTAIMNSISTPTSSYDLWQRKVYG